MDIKVYQTQKAQGADSKLFLEQIKRQGVRDSNLVFNISSLAICEMYRLHVCYGKLSRNVRKIENRGGKPGSSGGSGTFAIDFCGAKISP